MPSTRPCAAFEPIAPDFNVRDLVESTPNFEWVVRIHCDMIDHQGLENFDKLVLIHVILGGKPLVIEGYQGRLDRWTFGLQWLRDNCGRKIETARDLTRKANVPLTVTHYLNHMALLTNQWTNSNYKDPDRQRMYLKDIDCPQIWAEKVRDLVPLGLFYMNESTGDMGGLGAVDEVDQSGHGIRRGRGIAKAGDLMSSLPKEMRAENLMCYIGHEGTYTPAHREMCASLGQNIMVECSTGGNEDGKPTKAGSSIWFMTETKERHVVSEYWLSRLGHDIEVENHFAQVNAWKAAPFKVYVVEQRVGDLILIPPLAPHQVWNRGTRTMKVAWNRTTVETLEMALNEALPRARMVCRDEQYKNKAIIYFTLQKYSKLLKMADQARQKKQISKQNDGKIRQVEKDFRRLHALFTQILLSESFLSNRPEKDVELIPFDGYITCSYCRCNIFNRFLTCSSCVNNRGTPEEDTYDICLDCYAMGRSCACISKLRWVEQFKWGDLVHQHEFYRHQILQKEAKVNDKSPKALKIELDRLGKKRTLAQVCQIELQKRPWNDITKPKSAVDPVAQGEETKVDENGNVKKKRKIRKSEKFTREHARCHIDCHWEPKWKQAHCNKCDKNYCFGVLFRAYDIMPQDVLSDPDWECPSCLNICGCRHCRYRPGYKPFTPSGTLLGHNTKMIADPRSVESLVDFSVSNIGWIQKAGDDLDAETRRLNRRKRAAEVAKAQNLELGEYYVNSSPKIQSAESRLLELAQQEGIPIDPALRDSFPRGESDSQDDEVDENPEGIGSNTETFDQLHCAPQYVVPEGGVLRSSEHAYDPTEAIIYDYPDPAVGLISTLPDIDLGESHVGTDAPATKPSPIPIEMISRKRKREKLNGENRADVDRITKRLAANKTSHRKSLIVKLSINRDKLVDLTRMALMAQTALDRMGESAAPVLGSDLSALNAAGWAPTDNQVPAKRSRVEQIPLDHDDEFTPSRYRDRRKMGRGGLTRPTPDAEITRRTTRLRVVTYEDPSEDEFDEILSDRTERMKLATMEDAVDVPQSEDPGGNENIGISSLSQPAAEKNKEALLFQEPHISNSYLVGLDGAVDHISEQPAGEPRRIAVHNSYFSTERSKSHTIGSRGASPDSKAMAEAEANRRAKLAALQGRGLDDEDWGVSSGLEEEAENIVTKQQHFSKSKRPLAKATEPSPTPRPAHKSSTAYRTFVVDWGNDSSEDDLPRRPEVNRAFSNAWTSVNTAKTAGLKPVISQSKRRPF